MKQGIPPFIDKAMRAIRPVLAYARPYARQGFYFLKKITLAHPRQALAVSALLFPVCWVLLLHTLAGWGFFGKIPSSRELRTLHRPQASEVYSEDGVLLGRYFLEDRTDVALKDIPDHFINALIATEDVRFYSHRGVDFRSMMRVFVKRGLLMQRSAGGGSTLDQQLAKNLFARKRFWIASAALNKLREIHVARRLNRTFSKDEILERYLNTVPFSDNAFGVQAASLRFFNKSVSQLKVEEAAVLVGMLKANSYYNPRVYPERAMARRNVVFEQMEKYLFITPQQADSLSKIPLRLRARGPRTAQSAAPYLLERIRVQLGKWCATQTKEDGTPYNLYTDGLKIYTSINSRMQAHAEAAVREDMPKIQQYFGRDWRSRKPEQIIGKDVVARLVRQTPEYRRLKERGLSEKQLDSAIRVPKPRRMFSWEGAASKEISLRDSVMASTLFMHAGLLALDPATGLVRAWVGGINHDFFQYDQVLAQRQAGSVFKPILYVTALEEGIVPCTSISNEAVMPGEFDGDWMPANSDGSYGGNLNLVDALAMSVNVVAARLIQMTGPKRVAEKAKDLGIRSKLEPYPALALGAADVTLQEMTSAYAILANGGRYVEPQYLMRIQDKNGKTLQEWALPDNTGDEVISPEHAAQICYMMIGVGKNGTARALKNRYGFTQDIACKTGTAQNQTDGWFIGALPGLVAGVRVGGQEPSVHFKSLGAGQGAATAVPIWANFMKRVLKDKAFPGLRKKQFTLPTAEAMEDLTCPPEDFPIYEDDFLDWYFQQQQPLGIPQGY